jgi:hypothetical protein
MQKISGSSNVSRSKQTDSDVKSRNICSFFERKLQKEGKKFLRMFDDLLPDFNRS